MRGSLRARGSRYWTDAALSLLLIVGHSGPGVMLPWEVWLWVMAARERRCVHSVNSFFLCDI
ncbi:hypothetical protein BDV27DRAFT_131158 [Aspergillus caelatus]|uniref:Uncharacterized protein n=1 Tax=Aspergillus caelatus TaxID=61420 RepID=A0A5N7A0F8_9EURO|nr:uncharacterized protein BDV27DRAFT_131158 [Aspergillus caelatus]KAE8362659.1 hypothetical protein BDV27DRAFT_131158 [Aspergillus caelatus]